MLLGSGWLPPALCLLEGAQGACDCCCSESDRVPDGGFLPGLIRRVERSFLFREGNV